MSWFSSLLISYVSLEYYDFCLIFNRRRAFFLSVDISLCIPGTVHIYSLRVTRFFLVVNKRSFFVLKTFVPWFSIFRSSTLFFPLFFPFLWTFCTYQVNPCFCPCFFCSNHNAYSSENQHVVEYLALCFPHEEIESAQQQ